MIPFSTQWGVSKSVIVRHGRFQGLVGALKSPCFCLRPRIWCCCGVRRRRKRLKSKIWTNAVEVYGYKVISCTFMYILWHSKSSWDFRLFRNELVLIWEFCERKTLVQNRFLNSLETKYSNKKKTIIFWINYATMVILLDLKGFSLNDNLFVWIMFF